MVTTPQTLEMSGREKQAKHGISHRMQNIVKGLFPPEIQVLMGVSHEIFEFRSKIEVENHVSGSL
jgi:hypothetical protein